MSGTSSTTPPLYGVDTSLTPEQLRAYEEIGAALAGWMVTLNAAATVYRPAQGATAQGLIELAMRETMLDLDGVGLDTNKEQPK